MGFKIVRSATAEQELAGYKIFGHSVPREDAYKKATAKDQFADDIQFPHMLHSVILHSPYAHARIKNIDTSKAEQLPGVAGVVTYKDVYEWEQAGQVHQVPPGYVLHDRVLFVGNPVAIVAAEDFYIAEQARDLIEVEYEELPFYLSPEESIADGAMPLHPNVRENTNLWGTQQISPDLFGNEAAVDAGLQAADVTVETEYREPAIKHMFLEHHTCIAQWRGNELFVWFSSQGVRQNWTSMASFFNMPQAKITAQCLHPGGGFGGKFNPVIEYRICALMAKKVAPRPVKLRTNFREQWVSGVKLEFGPCTFNVKVGAKNDGTITAIKAYVLKGQGAYRTGQIMHGMSNFAYNYRAEAKEYKEHGIWTNTLDAGALRAYGSQCACFALDGAMNEISEKLGMDHADFILQNGGKAGDNSSATGHIASAGSFPKATQLLMDEFGWKARWKGWKTPTLISGSKRRGLGIAICNHCTGEFSSARDGALVTLNSAGCALVVHNVMDVGNGGCTTACMIVSEVLGIPYEKVAKSPAISTAAPTSGIAYCASRGLPTINTAVWRAAHDVKRQLLENGAKYLGVTPAEVDIKDETVYVKADQTKSRTYAQVLGAGGINGIGYGLVTDGPYADIDSKTGRPYAERGNFVAGVEVEVDTDTGEVTVVDLLIVPQGGMVVNPELLRGQLTGGAVHGMSQMLGEGFIYDEGSGTPLNQACYNYQTMTSMDVDNDKVNVCVDSDPNDAWRVPFHAKGITEGIYCASWPAIHMAIYNAIGVRLKLFPFQPEHILSALGKATFPKKKSVA